MNVSQALLQRKSVRAFLDKPVSKEIITKILHHARQAPSGTNTQPWIVAVVSGKTKKQLDKKLLGLFTSGVEKNVDYNYYPTHMSAEFKRRRLECGMAMYQTLGISRDNSKARIEQWSLNYSAFGAPVELYFFAEKIIEEGSFMDCGMFIQSVMLMATSLGLATCPQAALAEYPHAVKETLGYSDDLILLCGMALGYEDTHALVNSYQTSREEVETFTKFFD